MQFVYFPLAILFALAGRALTFNITLGKQVLPPEDILAIEPRSVPTECVDACGTARQNIGGCNNDTACLCKGDVIASLQGCQQCMFTQLIEKNQKPQDPRVGSSPLMAAYAKSCTDANITLAANQTALVLPKNWDGPFVAVLPVGGVAFAVIAGGFLGFSALMLLSNMS